MSAILPYATGPIEIEVDIAAQSAGGRWDDDLWSFATWDQATGEGSWLDLTCDISELALTSGASSPDGICTKVAGTTGSIALHGAQYDPWAGLWPPNVLGPDLPVRIQWRRPAGYGANLLPAEDGGFEGGTTGSWGFASATIANSGAQAAAGSRSLALTCTDSVNNLYGYAARVAASPGVTYAISAASRPGSTPRAMQVAVWWLDSGGGFLGQSAAGIITEVAGGWATATLSVVAPAGAAFAQPVIAAPVIPAGEVHYIDAVALSAWRGDRRSWG